MTPSAIFQKIQAYINKSSACVCDLHSSCTPSRRGNSYRCTPRGSNYPVLNFDNVKDKFDENRLEKRKSVDGLCFPPSDRWLCFVELKSWVEFIKWQNPNADDIRLQAEGYKAHLKTKFNDSIEICNDILALDGGRMDADAMLIFVTDIPSTQPALNAINMNLVLLANTASHLLNICHSESSDAIRGVPDVEKRYWQCWEFDRKMASL